MIACRRALMDANRPPHVAKVQDGGPDRSGLSDCHKKRTPRGAPVSRRDGSYRVKQRREKAGTCGGFSIPLPERELTGLAAAWRGPPFRQNIKMQMQNTLAVTPPIRAASLLAFPAIKRDGTISRDLPGRGSRRAQIVKMKSVRRTLRRIEAHVERWMRATGNMFRLAPPGQHQKLKKSEERS